MKPLLRDGALLSRTGASKPDRGVLISFCMFVYNQERYIEEAVEGAFNQTYSPLEIIISDDCSSDSTVEKISRLIDNYRGPHKVVLNLNEVNLGFATQVNKVLAQAKGEWLVFAAGDDVSMPDRVSRTWAVSCSSPQVRGIHCTASRIDEGGVALGVISPVKVDLDVIEHRSMLGAVAAYHREVFDLFGPMDTRVQNEDMVLSLRALLIGEIASFPDSGVLWRRHANNMSGRIGAPILDQVAFSLCDYQRGRLFSSIQQLRDVLGTGVEVSRSPLELRRLERRLLRAIRFNLSTARFSGHVFYKEPVPWSLKGNPFLWLYLFRKLMGSYVAEYRRKRRRAER